jgi:hypothetical protein
MEDAKISKAPHTVHYSSYAGSETGNLYRQAPDAPVYFFVKIFHMLTGNLYLNQWFTT